LRVALAAADDGVDARDQFFPVEGFGQVIVGAEAEALELAFRIVEPRQDQDRRVVTRALRSWRSTSCPVMSGRFRSSRMMS
jgi:hypothetical protein